MVLKLLLMEEIIIIILGCAINGSIRGGVSGAGADVEGNSGVVCCPLLGLYTKKFFAVAVGLFGRHLVRVGWGGEWTVEG